MPGFREHETPDDARLLRVSGWQDGAGRLVGGTTVPVLTEPEATTSGDEERAGVSGVGQAEVLVAVDVADVSRSVGRDQETCGSASRVDQVEDVVEQQEVGGKLRGGEDEHRTCIGRASRVVVVADHNAVDRAPEVDHVADTRGCEQEETVLRDAQTVVRRRSCRQLKDVEEVENGAGVADFVVAKMSTAPALVVRAE